MKKSLLLVILMMVVVGMNAQPTKRRVTTSNAAAQAAQQKKQQTVSDRASMSFPTAAEMPEDVVWKRDIYRTLDLMQDKNAPLYYPVEPIGRQVNLFTYLFRLMLTGRITAYTYKLDGVESFEAKDKLAVKDVLDRYGIYYEEKDGKYTVENNDVPSAEVTRYYIKESVYLDVAPWLAKLPMMASNYNNVNNMTADDFFTMNRYEGRIYKTNNMQGRALANYCKTDSDMVKEQKKIENEISLFQNNVWGHLSHEDSLRIARQDSIAAAQGKQKNVKAKSTTTASRSSSSARASRSSSAGKSGGSSSSAPRVSVRRQRR